MNIGKTIQTLRREKCLKQQFFAKNCGISGSYLSEIELGVVIPPHKTIDKICETLQIPVALLYLYSLDEEDIPIKKRPAYELVKPALEALIKSLVID